MKVLKYHKNESKLNNTGMQIDHQTGNSLKTNPIKIQNYIGLVYPALQVAFKLNMNTLTNKYHVSLHEHHSNYNHLR